VYVGIAIVHKCTKTPLAVQLGVQHLAINGYYDYLSQIEK
jgi:hypothetical protein